MKVLFISSGYLGIYPFLEESIIQAFTALNHTIFKIPPKFTKETMEWVECFQPNFVLTFVGYKTDKRLLHTLKESEIPLCVWLTEDPYYLDQSVQLIEEYDYIFTIDLGACNYYKGKFPHKNILHLPLGTDPSIYYPSTQTRHPLYDICLVGFPYPNRIDLIDIILSETPFSIFLAGADWLTSINKKVDRLTIYHKWLKPELVREIFSQSKIILNPHRSFNFNKNQNTLGIENLSINNRTFDIAACSSFQLIESKVDISMHFDPATEIVPYSNFDECIQFIYQFIDDENARNFYSQNARDRVLKSHTLTHRVESILKQINEK